MMPTLRTSFLALGLTLALAACGRAAPLTEQEQHTVTELTANMKTRCVGRYLIDLPAEVQTSGSATLKGVQVSTEKMTQQEFLKEMQQRETELRAMKHLDGYQFFYSDSEAYVNKSDAAAIRKQGIWYFIHLGEIDAADTRRVIEVYKWDSGYRLQLQIRTWDYSNSDSKNAKEMGNEVPRNLSLIFDLAGNFQGRADDDIPTGPGVCIDGGFIAGAASDAERFDTYFSLTDKRDVYFNIVTDANYQADTTLLQRGDQVDAQLEARKGRTIRKGPLNLSGLSQPEEWLMSGTTDSKVAGHHFSFEANSHTGSAKTPIFMLDMDNGLFPDDIPPAERIHASLTEGEAVALWDAVSRTIRVRPGAMDAMPEPKVDTRRPLGTLARSGQPCPQPGHYRVHWNDETYRITLYYGPTPTLNLMEPVPYRWLPGFVNRMLLKHERLPMALASHEVDWVLTSYIL